MVAAPGEPTAFVIEGSRENVANYARENSDLIIEFNDGRVLRIRNFFAHGGNYNDLIFEAGGGGSYELPISPRQWSRAVTVSSISPSQTGLLPAATLGCLALSAEWPRAGVFLALR